MVLLGLRVAILVGASTLGLMEHMSASPISTNYVLRASTSVDLKTLDSRRHSVVSSSSNMSYNAPNRTKSRSLVTQSSTYESLVYASDFSNGAKSEARRELFSIPTAAPTAAVVCQIGDEDKDTDLGCSFDDSTNNDG